MLKDKKILLLEGGPEKKFNLSPKYSNRVSALSEATRSLMMEIGAWSVIENARFSIVKKMQVLFLCQKSNLNDLTHFLKL
jgi:2-polyprenyl-6-methoxyphenol hydroxylase-like FAD-dependent oxidoreductase